MPQSGKPDGYEDLVEDERLARAWEYILMRAPGLLRVPRDRLFDAVPSAWIQPPKDNQKAVACFAFAENNPRFEGFMQVSTVHMDLEGWRDLQTQAAIQHPFGNDISRDPLVWVMFQALKGHLHTMANLRAMSHPVTRIDPHGQHQIVH